MKLNTFYDVLFSVSVSYWNGQKQIKFRLVDIKKYKN